MWSQSGDPKGTLRFQYGLAPGESAAFQTYNGHTFFWGEAAAAASTSEEDTYSETPTFGHTMPESYSPIVGSKTTMRYSSR